MSFLRPLLCCTSLAALALASTGLSAVERGPAQASASRVSAPAGTARVIVRFKSGATVLQSQAQALAAQGSSSGPRLASTLGQRLGLALANGRALDSRTQVMTAAGVDAASLVRRLSAQSDVEWAAVDQRRFAFAAPNDPLYASAGSPAVGQWYLRAASGSVVSPIDVENAWSVTEGSSSLVVAVLDTGITSHPDLSAKLLAGYDFIHDVATANDGDAADSDPSDPGDWITTAEDASGSFSGCGQSDSSWHGTETAGLIGASTHNGIGMAGVAPNVKLLPVRVLGKCGGYDSDIVSGMRWAAGLSVPGVTTNAHPARVLNLSLGSSDSCTDNSTSALLYRQAMTELTAAGVVVVASAGNDGLAVNLPANCSGVIAVAGVRHTGTKVGYSSLGPEVTVSAPAGNCVNETGECLYPILTTSNTGTTAPVSAKYTTGGSDASLGTSFSAPLVSGTVALMLSAKPALTPDQVKSALKATARSFPSSGAGSGVATCQAPGAVAQDAECYCTTSTCGAGLLDAGAAVAAVAGGSPVISATPSAPVAGAAVNLDGSASQVASGRSIASYAWQITAGSTIARFTSGTGSATATLDTSAAGTVTVQLTVTDNLGTSATTSKTLTVSASALKPVITASTSTPKAGASVTLADASTTLDSGRSLASQQWTIVSGSGLASFQGSTTAATATLLTNAAGSVTVQLTVTDSEGLSASTTQTLTVLAATPTAAISASDSTPTAGDTVSLGGSGSTASGGQTISSYQWAIVSGGSLATFSGGTTGASASLLTSGAGTVVVRLTVTDSAGLTASTTQSLSVAAAASSGGGGGGAWSPLAGLGLLLVAGLLPRRRTRGR